MSDEFWTNEELNLRLERLVVSFESIAKSLEGLNEESKKAGTRYWPGPKEQKTAILTRIESDDERERKLQGARRRTIGEILDPNIGEEDEEYIGERERQWLRDHPRETQKAKVIDASPETVSVGEQDRASVEAVESETGSDAVDTSNNKTAEERPKRRTKNRS